MKIAAVYLRFVSALGALTFAAAVGSADAEKYDTAHYTIDPPLLPSGQCLVGFGVTMINGVVSDVSNLPLGSSIDIVNSSSWGVDPDNRTTIEVGVQTSVLDPGQLRKFRLHVLKQTQIGPPFQISGWIEKTKCSPDSAADGKVEREPLKPETFKVVK
jgi:hypothetical protein